MSMAYLARWTGPINESDDPYDDEDACGNSPTGLTVQKHTQKVYQLPPRSSATDNDAIKNAIMTHGGVFASMRWDSSCYKGSTFAYYYGGSSDSANHGITLIGWDDNYSASNFKSTPSGDGAFLMKNSWGTSWGDNGYFWISYYDTVLARYSWSGIFYDPEPMDNYDYNYQYDPYGWVGSFDNGSSTTWWFANVFTATASHTLQAVSFYAAVPDSTYEVRIYKSPDSSPLNTGGYELSQTGTLTYADYHTIDLTSGVDVASGQEFSVVVKLTTPSYTSPIPVEYAYSGYSSVTTASAGQSYIRSSGTSGNWTDLTQWKSTANVCLKAFATVAGILGDTNGDDSVNSTDALIVLSCDVGVNTSQYCPMNYGDVNDDGLVNSTDALIILSYDVGISVPYPVGEPGCPSSVTPCPGCTP